MYGSDGKQSAGRAGDLGLIPGREDPLEKRVAINSSILAWRITWRRLATVHGVAESDMTDTFTHISSKLFFPKDTLPGNPKDSTCEWKLQGPYRPLQPHLLVSHPRPTTRGLTALEGRACLPHSSRPDLSFSLPRGRVPKA